MALQHLRSSTANKRPNPTIISDGQIALNTNDGSPGLFFKDSNSGLVKAGPVHVGATAPNVSPAGTSGNSKGEMWLDTSVTPNELKTWNGSAWVSSLPTEVPVAKLQDGSARQLLQTAANGDDVEWTSNVDIPGTLDVTGAATLDSTLGVNGAATAASFIPSSSSVPTNGVYLPAANTVGVATNSAERLRITSTGLVGIGTGSPAGTLDITTGTYRGYFDDSAGNLFRVNAVNAANSAYGPLSLNGSVLTFQIGASERARIDSSGRLLVGTSTAVSSNVIQTFNSGIDITSYSANQFANGNLFFIKSRGTTAASTTLVAANDELGGIYFSGADGSSYKYAASIRGDVDGAPGTNDMPGRLVFSTTADGAASPTERMRITNDGKVGIGTTSPSALLHLNAPAPALLIARSSAAGTPSATGLQLSIDGTTYGRIYATPSGGIGFSGPTSDYATLDNSGRLLVGTSSNRTGAALQVEGTTFGTSLGTIANNSANSAPAYFQLIKSRGTSVGSQALVSNGDGLGNVQFVGTDGTQQLVAAAIEGVVDGTPGLNDMPGRLVFATTADGAASPTERLRITSAGFIGVGTSSPETAFQVKTTTGNIAATIESDGVGPFLRFLDPGSSEWAAGIPDGSGALAIIQGRNPVSAGTERLRIDNAGRLLVGTSTATGNAPLQVIGEVRASTASTQDAVVLAGRAGGSSSYAVSITPTTLTGSRTLTLADGDTTLVAGTMVPTSGATMTGFLTLNAAPTSNLHAATKLYVDEKAASTVTVGQVLALSIALG